MGATAAAASPLRSRFLLPAAGEEAGSPLLDGAAIASATAVGDVVKEVPAEAGAEAAAVLGTCSEAPAAWPAAVGELAGGTCDREGQQFQMHTVAFSGRYETQSEGVRHWYS